MAESKIIFIKAFFLFILFFYCVPKVSAIETRSYLVTGYQEVSRRPHTIVLYHKNITFPWKSGKVVVSGSPDGTQMANIAWRIMLFNNKSNSKTFSYDNSDKNNICVDVDIPPLNITHILVEGDNPITVRFDKPCYGGSNDQNIGPIYLVHFDDYEISDEPFLDLPWDYTADGERFEEVALRMSSYFDHEYPLLSTNLREIGEVASSMVVFKSINRVREDYSSHDGYDWARSAGAIYLDPVLASAEGWATYHYNKFIGNAIYIDHDNGYQTRYYHLDPDSLVTKSSSKIWVNNRQQIGKVGFTGNVRPTGNKGSHIHFMVIKDKDGNGSFDDNIPDGIVDPFGWQAAGPDPWPAYSFTYNGKDQTGAKSTYLWKKSMKERPRTITSDGAKIGNSGSNTTFDFPFQVVSHDVIFDSVTKSPIVKPSIDGVIRDTFASIGSIVSASMKDGFDNLITSFAKKFTLTFTFQDQDIARYKPDSLSIYSSPDGVEWKKEETTINSTKKQASTQIDHLTEFALFGEKLDSIAPTTTIEVSGTKIGEYFTSPVLLALNSIDTPFDTTLGVLYTGYSVNEAVWKEYTAPVTISDEGTYTVEYYSEDGDGNSEMTKTLAFVIDFTPPTPTLTSSPTPTNIITPSPTITAIPISTQAPTKTQTPTSSPSTTPTTSSSTIETTVSTNSPKPTASLTKQPFPSTPRKVANIPPTLILEPENQGEVKSVFAAESRNETAHPEDNTYPSLSLRNLFIMIMVCITAIILVWYRATRRKEIAT